VTPGSQRVKIKNGRIAEENRTKTKMRIKAVNSVVEVHGFRLLPVVAGERLAPVR
jgi:hypothetical protein